jgi:YggT family protein
MTYVILTIIDVAYTLILILLFARMILSWTNIGGYQLRYWIYRVTEPLLAPIRNLLPQTGGIDLSPMILLFGLLFLRRILTSALL